MYGIIFLTLGGLFFVVIGWRIWKYEQITLIQSSHYAKVSKKDKKPFTKMMGKARLIIGIGMIVTGLINYITGTMFGWICFGVSYIVGFAIIIKAMRKYNGGMNFRKF